jgi:hypothetical protein
VKSVDVMRGFAVLWMVSFQILDLFMSYQMSSLTMYYILDFVNWLPFFMFVSGVSVWLTVNKRLSLGFSRWKIFLHALKRYVSYIFIGFMVCLWCFSFQTFLDFNEILVAIGVYALVTLCLLIAFFSNDWIFVPLAFVIYALSFWFGVPLQHQAYPFYLMLPFYFLGVFSAKFIVNKCLKRLTLFEFLLLIAILLLILLGDDFSYVRGSLGFVVFNVFLVILLLVIVDNFQNLKILNVLSYAGRNALFFYIFYFAVFFKLAVSFGTLQNYNLASSVLLTFLSVAAIFLCAYLTSRSLQYFRKIVAKLGSRDV